MIIVELVAGLDIGEDTFGLLWMTTPAISPAFRFLEEGRGGLERSGFPNASPAAAIPTVLEATSYRCQHKPQKVDKAVKATNCKMEVLRLCVEMVRRGMALVVIFVEGTHTWNSLHDELSPLAHRPPRKEKIEKNAVIVEELKSIVEDGPFQLCSKT